jgi:CP family cyanate transporter-like MFS transporter
VSRGHIVIAIALLWLAGNALRLPVLAVPPVLTTVQADLHMSGTQVGILSGLPVILFAIAALPGSLLIARIGPARALVVGLLITAIGTALRGAPGGPMILYVATAVLGAGIAVLQPALPALVRQWLPDRIGFATAVFTNGLIVGEFVPVMLMTPAVLPLVGASWRWALAFWAIPLLAIAALTVALAPRLGPWRAGTGSERPRWWPDWRDPVVWQLALILGSANSTYFGANTFLPAYLEGAGRPDLIPAVLTALNVGQLPASLLLLVVAGRLERRAWPLVGAGIAAVVCIGAIVASASAWTIAFAGALGFFVAATLVFSLALAPLLQAPADVARTSAAMFAVGYAEAMIVSVLGGAAWDLTGSPAAAFLPIALSLLPLVLLPGRMRFRRLTA